MYSSEFSDIYFSREGALAEKDYVFVKGNRLADRWKCPQNFTICELGFGAGFSFLATANAWAMSHSPASHLRYIGIDLFPISASDMAKTFLEVANCEFFLPQELLVPYCSLNGESGRHCIEFDEQKITLELLFVDVIEALQELQKKNTRIDAWYLDGFSPAKNPAMWDSEVIRLCREISAPYATLATYSVAKSVRDKLGLAGFVCERVKGFGSKRNALVAHL